MRATYVASLEEYINAWWEENMDSLSDDHTSPWAGSGLVKYMTTAAASVFDAAVEAEKELERAQGEETP